MKDYIELDGYCYRTTVKTWSPPMPRKPMTVRVNVNGTLDVTYAAAAPLTWGGELKLINSDTPPDQNKYWGSQDNIEVTLAKLQAVTFVDHFEDVYSVHVRPLGSHSSTPMWDAESNSLYYGLTLIGVPAAAPAPRYALSLGHDGNGTDPLAHPEHSVGCDAGQYLEGEAILLSWAVPDEGYLIVGWEGTDDDNSTAAVNTLTMPAAAHEVKVNYEIPVQTFRLTLGHTGSGADPVADPTHSEGAEAGYYLEGEEIALVDAIPDEGWEVGSWTGTENDEHTGEANALTMPADDHEILVNYIETPE